MSNNPDTSSTTSDTSHPPTTPSTTLSSTLTDATAAIATSTSLLTHTSTETVKALTTTTDALNDFHTTMLNALGHAHTLASARLAHATTASAQCFQKASCANKKIADAAKLVEKEHDGVVRLERQVESELEDVLEMKKGWEEEYEKKVEKADQLKRVQVSKIKLDIGGKIHHISIDTLLQEPNTFFTSMFAGRWHVKPTEKDGTIFIDRDGEIYHYIFDYLRNGDKAVLPKDQELRQRLINETEYLGMEGLKAKLEKKETQWKGGGVVYSDWVEAKSYYTCRVCEKNFNISLVS
ncbi:BTB/POZ domain-containing protein kctd6 [Rhizophlyctis rosea]|nr:BTB/POZ domain-containing protein kctd6 [Rhizophlyctis rosea]